MYELDNDTISGIDNYSNFELNAIFNPDYDEKGICIVNHKRYTNWNFLNDLIVLVSFYMDETNFFHIVKLGNVYFEIFPLTSSLIFESYKEGSRFEIKTTFKFDMC